MKRFLSTLLILFFCSAFIFAEEDQGDEYDDGYVYEQNGSGDRFIKISIEGLFPLNFNKQLKTGGSIELGYYKFLNKWFALGGEFLASYNISIGKKVLVMLPFTVGALFQPSYEKFEFPIYVTTGISYESFQSQDYFPSFTFKVSPGAYYRLNEMCSLGLSSTFMWIPQWYSDPTYNKNGLFMTLAIGARYHF